MLKAQKIGAREAFVSASFIALVVALLASAVRLTHSDAELGLLREQNQMMTIRLDSLGDAFDRTHRNLHLA